MAGNEHWVLKQGELRYAHHPNKRHYTDKNNEQALILIKQFFQLLGVTPPEPLHPNNKLRYEFHVSGKPISLDFSHTDPFVLTALAYRGDPAFIPVFLEAALQVFPDSEKSTPVEATEMIYDLREPRKPKTAVELVSDVSEQGNPFEAKSGGSAIANFGFEGELLAVQYLQDTFGQRAWVEHHNAAGDAQLPYDVSLHFRQLSYHFEVKRSEVGHADLSARQWRAHRDVRTHLILEVHPSSFRMVKLSQEECERHLRKVR